MNVASRRHLWTPLGDVIVVAFRQNKSGRTHLACRVVRRDREWNLSEAVDGFGRLGRLAVFSETRMFVDFWAALDAWTAPSLLEKE